MTTARNHHLYLTEPTFFHLVTRCVRQAFLCGKDKHTGNCYDHRKRWLEKRIFKLSRIFFIDLYGYAILSNHYHLIIQTRPDAMNRTTDAQIAERWCRLFPHRTISISTRVKQLCQDQIKINQYRQRLSDISWFMRCLNENIARKANHEDNCKGRFWQGRFYSQLLLDESAVFTCMAYVDLNPIRAGIANSPEKSAFTSIRYRIYHHSIDTEICPLNQSDGKLSLVLEDYLLLVDETFGIFWQDKTSTKFDKSTPVLKRLGLKLPGYLHAVQHFNQMFSHGLGSVILMEQLAKDLKLRWVKGISRAREIYQ